MTPSSRDAVQFTRESAERIAGVVRAAELTPTHGRPLTFDRSPETTTKKIRFGEISSGWPLGASIQLTVPLGTGQTTINAINTLSSVPISDFRTSTEVVVAKDGTAWSYVNHQRSGCDTESLPAREITGEGLNLNSDDSSIAPGAGVQVLANVAGCMKWIGLSPATVITGASIQGASVVFSRKRIWILSDSTPEQDLTLVGTNCNT